MFIFSANTRISSTEQTTVPVKNAIGILERDMKKVFCQSDYPNNEILLKKKQLSAEEYRIEITKEVMTIMAGEDLGFIYGLLYLSEHFLEIKPFWFWMDQVIPSKSAVNIEETTGPICSPVPVVRFRGFFFNDEVLMMKWKYNQKQNQGWKMCFEALLRCGGNMVIPGTDKMSRKNRKLAADMGLWITHHHAEPLGAEMYIRAYPGVSPNYEEHADLFEKLWEKAVIEQKDCKVVWNLCFRGQGDMPFWETDTTGKYDTLAKRGALISKLIQKQCDIVRKHVKNPIFCTNLYGEIMELYKEGYIDLEDDIIKVKADNGYGKMVTRRQSNHNARVSSMPSGKEAGAQGIYYHVSFYDLQAANHITMLPNSVDFVNRELSEVLEKGGDDFWVINCSNVRPHVYHLDAIRKKWFGVSVSDRQHSEEFCRDYYHGSSTIARCYQEYPKVMLSYGEQEDEHMGEQFYTENVRTLAHNFMINQNMGAKSLYWVTGKVPLSKQMEIVQGLCQRGLGKLQQFAEDCERLAKAGLSDSSTAEKTVTNQDSLLFHATLVLQAKLHALCAEGVVTFVQAYQACTREDYVEAFLLLGKSAELFDEANKRMREAEYGVWEDFYLNDCLADVKHTAYMIRKMMGLVRELGDNERHDRWYREYCYAKEDRDVFLLLVEDNHMTDEELYQVMRKTK